ncbi:DNA-binding CsgD family transcriptional regulator [Leeuwenhoekiella aequorea]|uniref:DNA-binding CsgD family transcriptional regulator n=1 Tax=Leeuwenhoekiella aequorea TaxID=283736 RepID=A0A4V1KQN9_9FLAO|nr:DNA-binding CsgD family transcriptional regulator [Leeuwenhoekiella aequorea]
MYSQNEAARDSYRRFSDSLFYQYKTELDSSLKSNDRELIVEAYVNLASFYKKSQIYTEAVANYTQALKQNNNENNVVLVQIKNSLGEVYIELGNYAKAIEYLSTALHISTREKLLNEKAKSLRLIGSCKEKMGNLNDALNFQQQSFAIYGKQNDLLGQAIVNENIGSIYEDLELYDKAYVHFEKAYQYFKSSNNEAQINALNNLADISRKTKRYDASIATTLEVLDLALKYNNAHQIESAYKDLSKAYAFKNDFEKAHTYLLKYQNLVEKQFYSQNFNQLNALQTIFDTREKQSQIDLLEQQNKASRARLMAIIILAITVLGAGLVSFIYLKRKRQIINKLQAYKQRVLEAELENKAVKEQNLKNEIQLKTATLSKYSLSISQKNKLIEEVSGSLQKMSTRKRMDLPIKINELALQLNQHLEQDNEWEQFMDLFEDIHPHFSKKLSDIALQKLTATELRLCLLLRLDLSSKEISSVLRITPDSVRVARYRLRKKLPIETQEELVNFMLKL